MKIALIDNYDSFTYNLYHLLKELNVEVSVFRNDQLTRFYSVPDRAFQKNRAC